MLSHIIVKNPACITTFGYIVAKGSKKSARDSIISEILKQFGLKDLSESKKLDDTWQIRFSLKSGIDYGEIECIIETVSDEHEISIDVLTALAKIHTFDASRLLNLEIFSENRYIITVSDLSAELPFSENLAYGMACHRIQGFQILFAKNNMHGYVMETLHNMRKFDLYYGKIQRLYHLFLQNYDTMQKSHVDLIGEYSNAIEKSDDIDQKKTKSELDTKILMLDGVNFGLLYDAESIESNLENMRNVAWILASPERGYFSERIKSAEVAVAVFERSFKKNTLIKDNIISHYRDLLSKRLDQERLDQEKNKIHHIKNIKEILSGLAFVEIFINGLSESSKIYTFSEQISKVLQNTSFMRMILISLFVMGYFGYVLVRKYFGKR